MFSIIKIAHQNLTEKYSPSIFNYFYEIYPQGLIVAEKNHKIIGFIIGLKTIEEKAKILMLAVSKNYRKQKVGTILLQDFIQIVKNEKIKKILLEVRKNNKEAITFYKKNGFQRKEILKEFYQNGEDALVMQKDL